MLAEIGEGQDLNPTPLTIKARYQLGWLVIVIVN